MFYYNSEVLPQVRLIGKVRYAEPWIHFARCIDEYLIYIIRDGDMYIKENGTKYHLKKNDFLVLEPNMSHEGYEKATCNYYYIHFKSTGISAITKEDENVYLSEMLKKRMDSIHSYNLDEGNVIDPFVCLPKFLHCRMVWIIGDSCEMLWMYIIKEKNNTKGLRLLMFIDYC